MTPSKATNIPIKQPTLYILYCWFIFDKFISPDFILDAKIMPNITISNTIAN